MKQSIFSVASTCMVIFAFLIQPKALYGDELSGAIINADHAAKFGRLLVQDSGGRIKPMDTLAVEVAVKISGQSSPRTLSASQVFLGIMSAPERWRNVGLIRITPQIAELLNLDPKTQLASFNDFFEVTEDNEILYRLEGVVDEAQRTSDSERDKFQKEIIKVDERVSIFYMIYQTYLLKIIPVKNDPNFLWISPVQIADRLSNEGDQKEAALLVYNYIQALKASQSSGDYAESDRALLAIAAFQETYGTAVIPSQRRISAEILLNHAQPFTVLMLLYFLIGSIYILSTFAQTLIPNLSRSRKMLLAMSGVKITLALLFVLHTASLGLRWYVAGHAPWSNGYESIIYISWAALFAGLIFSKHSTFVLPAATMMAAFSLMTAFISSMDPQISNLQPVLRSYWLTIHVSVISASYGFLGLSMLLGVTAIIMFSFRRPNSIKIDYSIRELNHINEMSMMVGLAFLTIGNIFGAIWANESWGRYWSWDPKETWTLISILVYASILHFRFIPNMRSAYTFSLASVLGFFSILMTYFGVNYYLSGMHSYANGEPLPIPSWLPAILLALFTLALFAWRKRDGRYPLER
ncbi:MAG: cytochrome c biogenesis protein CcsA [Helicobacteraceae bacterium]|jgi:cytochrome c-type biogenesis protein CcsB|nr:cytochrome c biogenesis protein CcsA [Helicobacteraceae bacterium]